MLNTDVSNVKKISTAFSAGGKKIWELSSQAQGLPVDPVRGPSRSYIIFLFYLPRVYATLLFQHQRIKRFSTSKAFEVLFLQGWPK